MIGAFAVLALTQMIGPSTLPATPQALHLCLFPEEPVVDEGLAAEYGISPKDEYDRYFSDLERFCKTRNHGIFIGVCL
jgi:hypothetical protein